MLNGFPGGFNRLVHPIAQIEAACSLYLSIEAFVLDEWTSFYTDPPPDEDALDEVRPSTILDILARLGMRFELAGYMESEDDCMDSIWDRAYQGTLPEVLFHNWAHRVMDAADIDSRALDRGLSGSDLVFIPDELGVASNAYMMMLDCDFEAVGKRVKKDAARSKKLWRSEVPLVRRARGDGPRTSGQTMADNIALALKAASKPLSPEEVAKRIKHANVASVTAALHQIVAYKKPKRLIGWVVRAGEGIYSWAGTPTPPTKGASAP